MQHNPRFLDLVEKIRPLITETDIYHIKLWQEEGKELNLIDVREESEWVKGHLPTARHIARGIIERDIETHYPNQDTPLYLYCGGGYRSLLAAHHLLQMGYTQVISVDGGVRSWLEAGFPLES